MMTHILLESPLKLIVIELAVGIVLIWWVRRAGSPRWLLPGGLVVAVGLLAVQAAVRTDAERIRALARELAQAVDSGQTEVILAHLHDDFETWGYRREEFVEFVYQQLQMFGVDEARVGGFELEISGDRARADFIARARVHVPDLGIQPYLGKWRIELRRDGTTWRVTGVTELSAPGAPTRGRPAS